MEEIVVRTRRYGNVLARKAFGRELYFIVESKTVGLIESYGTPCRRFITCPLPSP